MPITCESINEINLNAPKPTKQLVFIINQDTLAIHWHELRHITIYNRCKATDFEPFLSNHSESSSYAPSVANI
jgi:hypothetical protein